MCEKNELDATVWYYYSNTCDTGTQRLLHITHIFECYKHTNTNTNTALTSLLASFVNGHETRNTNTNTNLVTSLLDLSLPEHGSRYGKTNKCLCAHIESQRKWDGRRFYDVSVLTSAHVRDLEVSPGYSYNNDFDFDEVHGRIFIKQSSNTFYLLGNGTIRDAPPYNDDNRFEFIPM